MHHFNFLQQRKAEKRRKEAVGKGTRHG